MEIGQKIFIAFSSKIIGSFVGFIATVYFARTLGPTIVGQYTLVIALLSWLKIFASSGVGSALKKRISESEDEPAFFTAGAISLLFLSSLLVFIIILAQSYINSYVGVSVAYFLTLILLAEIFSTWTSSALDGNRLVHVSAVLSSATLGIRSLIQIGLIFFGLGLSGMLIGYGLGTFLLGVLGLTIVSPSFAIPSREHFQSLFEYARYAWLGSLESRTFDDMDILVLGMFVSSGLVGIYSVAWSIGKFLTVFENSINATLFPEISFHDQQTDDEQAPQLIADSLTFGGLVLIPGFVGGVVLSERLLRIYGPEFVDGTAVFGILLCAFIFHGYQKQLITALNGLNRPNLAFRVNAVFIVLNLVLNVVFVTTFGWVGAAVATLVSAVVGLTTAYITVQATIDLTAPTDEILRQIVAAVLMGGCIYGALRIEETYLIVQNNVIIVATLVTLGAAVYFLILLLLSTRFRRTIRRNTPSYLPTL